MAFNNGFPVTYQPAQIIYPQAQQIQTPIQMPQMQQVQQVQAPAPTQSGIIWVNGEAGAKSYPVAPNASVQLWDLESQTIYLKSMDANGIPSYRTIDYTFRDTPVPVPPQAQTAKAEYVTADAFKEFQDYVNTRIAALSAAPAKAEKQPKKKGEATNESIADDE